MGKYILRNATTTSLNDVYLIREGTTGNWFRRISGSNLINLVNNADIIAASYGGGGGGPEWAGISTFTVDFNSSQSLLVYHNNGTTTLTGHPATCTSNNSITGYYYVEYSQNDPALVKYDETNNYYSTPWELIGRGRTWASGEPAFIAQPEVVQIQKASTAITSVFPGVTYNGNSSNAKVAPQSDPTPYIAYNPVNANPYTVYIYDTDGTLLDTYIDCDVYYCLKTGYAYNEIYESTTSSDGAIYFAEVLNSLYSTSGEGVTIQYSTSTTGDSWTDIGYYRPFPDNVKRVKITLITY